MKFSLPRKRVILAFHRWLGVFSALFLFLLALTGLALNHAERLGLDDVTISSPIILSRYGMSSGGEIRSWRIHDSATVSHLGGQLFYEGEQLSSGGPPVGIYSMDPVSVIATAEGLVLLTSRGELIEKIEIGELPFGEITLTGKDPDGNLVIVTNDGQWKPDEDWLEYHPYQGGFSVDPQQPVDTDKELRKRILQQYQGEGLSLYRVLLDLHSGRLFGWGGRTLMDLTAVAILLLLSSGIAGWLRKSAWGRR